MFGTPAPRDQLVEARQSRHATAALPNMDPDTLRRQAAHFRRLAELISDEAMARSVRSLAEEYEHRAANVEAGGGDISPRDQ
jgi:hypothetical protein